MFLTTYIKCKLKYSYATSKFIGYIIRFSMKAISDSYFNYFGCLKLFLMDNWTTLFNMYEYLNILHVDVDLKLLFGRFIYLTLTL